MRRSGREGDVVIEEKHGTAIVMKLLCTLTGGGYMNPHT